MCESKNSRSLQLGSNEPGLTAGCRRTSRHRPRLSVRERTSQIDRETAEIWNFLKFLGAPTQWLICTQNAAIGKRKRTSARGRSGQSVAARETAATPNAEAATASRYSA